MNSKQKGKRGELEVAHFLQKYGLDARRGQQYCGIEGDADVIGLEGFHIEVKRTEKLNLSEAMKQSQRDAKKGEVPIVVHRKSHEQWQVTLDFGEFLTLVLAHRIQQEAKDEH